MSVRFLQLCLLLAACSCVTPYQPKGLTGGYSEEQVSENSFRVFFLGNPQTSPAQASDFALLRASELALEHGYAYLAIIDTADDELTSYRELTPVQSTTTHGQIQTSTTVTPVITFVNHNSSHTVVFHEELPPRVEGAVGARATERVLQDSWSIAVGEIVDARRLRASLRNKYGMRNETPVPP